MATVQHTVELEQRTDRWAAYVPEFGFTTYGHTQKEATEAAESALQALLDSFGEDKTAQESFIESHKAHTIKKVNLA